jgi:hypothetical protein
LAWRVSTRLGAGMGGWRRVMASRMASYDVYHIARLFSRYFQNLNLYLSCREPWFVIIKPLGVELDLICVMYSRLTFVWVLMHIVDPLLLCKWFHRVWPSNLWRDDTLLSLNDQSGLVEVIVHYFLGCVVTLMPRVGL